VPPTEPSASSSAAPPGLGARPIVDLTQEVRFAVVLYGGVSLAIYINGVVQELLALVRATAPERPTGDLISASGLEGYDDHALFTDDELTPVERVYRDVGRLLAAPGSPPVDVPAGAPAPIRTRFVVDVISGSSAGGINGVFLAKALANGQRIDNLKRLWVDEGDIDLLINDARSKAGIDDLRIDKPPQSLLNSRRMYRKLLDALQGMDDDNRLFRDGESCFVDELDLWVTATDLQGLLLPIDLHDAVVYEPRHRTVFHFRSRSEYATGEVRNDFGRPVDPLLAFAARSTSSFPFAFDPMTLADVDEVLRSDAFRAYRGRGSACLDWDGFFGDYVAEGRRPLGDETIDQSRERYRRRAFGDGGYLDNKPFTWATENLSRRRADLPVDRRLIYIEPDPGRPRASRRTADGGLELPPSQPESRPKPNALSNALLAAHSLPRAESIRDDLDRLLERNRRLARLEEVTAIVDAPFRADDAPAPGTPGLPVRDWREKPIVDLLAGRGAQYAAYHRLKVAGVLDELAESTASLAGYDTRSDERAGIRAFIQAWFDHYYESDAGHGGGPRRQTDFLFRFDFGYRSRRFHFLGRRIDELLRLDDRARRMLEAIPAARVPAPDEEADFRAALRQAKRALSHQYKLLRRDGRFTDSAPVLRERVRKLGITPADLRNVLEGALDRDESVARARDVLERRDLWRALDRVGRGIATSLARVFRTSHENTLKVLPRTPPDGVSSGTGLALVTLRSLFDAFELYDSVLLPVSAGEMGETDQVEVIRISPEDAPSLIDETSPTDGRRKLAGVAVGHFGGFLDRAWRKNDLLWGRLDGAERLITTLLPGAAFTDERAKLLERAQLAILEEELELDDRSELKHIVADAALQLRPQTAAGPLPGRDRKADNIGVVRARLEGVDRDRLTAAIAATWTAPEMLDYLRDGYEVDRRLDSITLLAIGGRASQVTGKVLDGISKSAPLPWASRALIRTGRLMWGLAEVATPRSALSLLWRYWTQLLILIGIVLILGGALLGAPSAAKAGWVTLFIAAGIRLFVWGAQDVLRMTTRPRSVRGFAIHAAVLIGIGLAVAVLALAALEVVLHLGEDVNDLVEKLPNWLEDALRWLWPWDDGAGPA
jgi:patatin-related protein